MAYYDFFALPLPRSNEDQYKKQVQVFLDVMKEFGMLGYCEAVADDVPRGKTTDFYRAVAATEEETVVTAFAVWPDKETRNRAWAEGMKDPRLAQLDGHMQLFDGKRLIYGGFNPLIEFGIE